MSAECVSCGAELPAGARFCPACGTSIGSVDPPAGAVRTVSISDTRDPARERKLATLLFVDIVDFTGLNEAQDPELVSGLVSDTFERLAREVERYEGTIEKFAGDAILAVFGVPATHEDDPERAVRAALEMQSVAQIMASDARGGPALKLRIGVETGEVLVDRARAVVERDLFVTGDAVNTAARLQQVAEPGTVVVGPGAYAATREVVDYDELRPQELKGKQRATPAWRAVSIKSGRGGRRTRLGMEAPMVGRSSELTLLKETVRRAVDEERPHLVTVVGSAGVGKSRLVWELEKYIDGLPDRYHWRKGRCLAYSSASFGPIADVAKADAGILDDDQPTVARTKLAKRLRALDLGHDEVAVRDALEAVLAIGDDRERPREALFEAWRRYLVAISRVAPLVLIVEDVHWADDGVRGFLDFLARWGEGPLVILCLARPELLEEHRSWGGGLRNASTIELEPLAPAEAAALMDGLLDGGVPSVLGERITQLTEGNPLFAEEMVRMLVDRGTLRFNDGRWQLARPVDEVEIPGSVQAVLAARLDALPHNEKRVAQDAAVIGRVFWDQLVAHIARDDLAKTNERLRRLRVKDLVVPREPSSLAGAAEFGFRHVLIRDVAYESLPKRDRAALHREIGEWAEHELSDRLDEFAELIASHFAAAVAYEEEFDVAGGARLTQLRVQARDAAVRAARRAWAMSQSGEANRWLRLAIELAWKTDLPVRQIAALTLEYDEIAFMVGGESEQMAIAERVLEAMVTLPDRTTEDEDSIALLRNMVGNAQFHAGDVEGSRRTLQDAIVAVGDGPPRSVRAHLKATLGWTYWRAGPVEAAVPILEEAVVEAEEVGDAQTLRWASHDLGVALGMLGDHDAAVRRVEESMRMAREAGDPNLVMRCYINLPAMSSARGDDIRPLVEMAIEGIGHARRAAAGSVVCWLAGNIAGFLTDLGRLEEALDYADEAVVAAEAHVPGNLPMTLSDRAGIHRLRGELEAARRDEERMSEAPFTPEPQIKTHHIFALAAERWATEPREAMAELAEAISAEVGALDERAKLAQWYARGALRLDEEEALAWAVRIACSIEDNGTPSQVARRDWITGLVDGSEGRNVESAARRLEEMGLLTAAADAWADAALLAARAGRSSPALDRALAITERIGMHPFLGSLPETRWLEPAVTAVD